MKEGANTVAAMIALAQQAANRLQGTCGSIAALGEEYEAAENSITFCDELDQLVFCCEQCNWWCEISEMAERDDDAWICQECTDEET